MFEHIVPQSAGSLAVAFIGLMMVALQIAFRLKTPYFRWVGWSAAVSFSGMVYAASIFLEYNVTRESILRVSGVMEFSALVFLMHSVYGLTFSYFNINGNRYHLVAGIFHGLLQVILWSTDYIVSRSFVAVDFKWLSTPYIEVGLGPLGPLFELYIAISSVTGLVFWILYKGPDPGYRYAYVTGIGCWLLFGIHDALASLGVPSVLYFMEYGYLGFSVVVLWIIFSTFADVSGEDKYRVITDFTSDGIVVIQDGKVVFGNPAAAELFGRNLVNVPFSALMAKLEPKERRTVLRHFETLLERGEFPDGLLVHGVGPGGGSRTVEARANMIRYRNKPAVLGTVRDVTEKIREAEALRESEEKISRLKKMESLGLLAGGVAHDLNNVLSGIVNYPELLLMKLPKESPIRKPLETIMKSGLKAVAIVQDLLTIARGVAVEKTALNLNDVIRDYLNSPEYHKLAQHHPLVSIRTRLDHDLLATRGSDVHIGKMVMNLVSNAAEAVSDRGVITISSRSLYLDQPMGGYQEVPEGEYVVLRVSDTGPGIFREDLKRIFEPFFSKKVMGRSGTGLGLTLVWNTMQDHNGYINVTSNSGGTTFDLLFPVTREAPSVKTADSDISELFGNGETVLVIDDVEGQREVSCWMLESLKYRATSVESGEAAIEYLKKHPVDLLLLDMVMAPGMSGRETYEAAVRIRPGQKAIIVSGYSKTREVIEMQAAGAGRYLRKPVRLETLGRALKETLGIPVAPGLRAVTIE
jgi:PAS domain S-box-containing protein